MKKEEKNKRMVVYAVVFVVIEAFALPLLYMDVAGLFVRECEMVHVNPEESMAMDTQPVQEQVQGATTSSITDSNRVGNLIVGPGTEDGKYKVFSSPDLTSEVIYLAEEGTTFDVLEDMQEWYRVQLDDGNTGWIVKQNVATESDK